MILLWTIVVVFALVVIRYAVAWLLLIKAGDGLTLSGTGGRIRRRCLCWQSLALHHELPQAPNILIQSQLLLMREELFA